jgi:hypothetical protein
MRKLEKNEILEKFKEKHSNNLKKELINEN